MINMARFMLWSIRLGEFKYVYLVVLLYFFLYDAVAVAFYNGWAGANQ